MLTALDAHGTAAAALDAGDYYSAFELSRKEGEPELEAVALLMCGWVEKALADLENIRVQHKATGLYMAFGRWCLGDDRAAEDIAPWRTGGKPGYC